MELAAGLLENLATASATLCFVGDAEGVVCRNVEGDAGDFGRRNGEARGEEPKPSGDGLYPDGVACALVSAHEDFFLFFIFVRSVLPYWVADPMDDARKVRH